MNLVIFKINVQGVILNGIKKIKGPWHLKNAYFPKNRGKVFSCFSCYGGSTMGYKLAGFDVIGCNEIDPKVIDIYKLNHNPRYAFNCSIREMLNIDLPKELYNLDILDGSPPCTSFSVAGVRERDWGKQKKFAEGQANQRLDDLFFEFIALANILKPKIVIAENVVGIVQGKAKGYIKEIIKAYSDAGYITQIFKLNSANMGVPQVRKRIFFISYRKDLNFKKLKLAFNEKPITFGDIQHLLDPNFKVKENLELYPSILKYYDQVKKGSNFGTAHPTGSFFNYHKLSFIKPVPTYCSKGNSFCHPTFKRFISYQELLLCSTFPMDLKHKKIEHVKWAMGMSVPPFMMQRIALEIYDQWIKNGPQK